MSKNNSPNTDFASDLEPAFSPETTEDQQIPTSILPSTDRLTSPQSSPEAVDVDQVESSIQAKQIGDRIRRLRTRRSMGLVELGTRTGLSASFLSQLETGRVIPTVRNLARIALTFNKDLAYFFRDDQPLTFRTMRRGERIRIHRNSDGAPSFFSESMHSLVSDGQLVPCIAEFEKNTSEATFKPKIFDGVEFTFIMEGTLILNSEGETATLNVGDIAWLDGTRKRTYCCPSGIAAKAMIITRHTHR